MNEQIVTDDVSALLAQEAQAAREVVQETSRIKDDDRQAWTLTEAGTTFRVRALHWQDTTRHAAYQALRYQIFFQQLHWTVAVTADGREVDRYDQNAASPVRTHVVYVVREQQEVLLAGVRSCALRDWQDTMVMGELQAAGLFPDDVLSALRASWQPERLLEITRLCVQRHTPQNHLAHLAPRQLKIAQDLTYAGMYQAAEQTERSLVLAVVSAGYLRILQRMGFVVQVFYGHALDHQEGYALTIIDLAASISVMRAQNKVEQVNHLLLLCQNHQRIENMAETG
jgi:N-acyl-L-homoserine lactone synthetase